MYSIVNLSTVPGDCEEVTVTWTGPAETVAVIVLEVLIVAHGAHTRNQNGHPVEILPMEVAVDCRLWVQRSNCLLLEFVCSAMLVCIPA